MLNNQTPVLHVLACDIEVGAIIKVRGVWRTVKIVRKSAVSDVYFFTLKDGHTMARYGQAHIRVRQPHG